MDDLEDWLASASWNMHKHVAADVQKFVGAIELRLAEFSSGHLDDEGLRDELQMLVVHGCPEPLFQVQMFLGPQNPVDVATSTTGDLMEGFARSYRLPLDAPSTFAVTRSASGLTVRRRHEVVSAA